MGKKAGGFRSSFVVVTPNGIHARLKARKVQVGKGSNIEAMEPDGWEHVSHHVNTGPKLV